MANEAVVDSYLTWVNVNNAKVSDDVYVTTEHLGVSGGIDPLYDKKVSLILANGSYGSVNKGSGHWTETTDTYILYGASNDTWGETLTETDINDVDFGVVLQVDQGGGAYSDYLKATNFGFSLPAGSTVTGITVEIERKYTTFGRAKIPNIDHIRMTVCYYTNIGSPSLSPSFSPSITPSSSFSLSPSLSESISLSLSPSVSLSLSPSISPSESPSTSVSVSQSLSPSMSLSPSPSLSISPSPSPAEYEDKYEVKGTTYLPKYAMRGNEYDDKYNIKGNTYSSKYSVRGNAYAEKYSLQGNTYKNKYRKWK